MGGHVGPCRPQLKLVFPEWYCFERLASCLSVNKGPGHRLQNNMASTTHLYNVWQITKIFAFLFSPHNFLKVAVNFHCLTGRAEVQNSSEVKTDCSPSTSPQEAVVAWVPTKTPARPHWVCTYILSLWGHQAVEAWHQDSNGWKGTLSHQGDQRLRSTILLSGFWAPWQLGSTTHPNVAAFWQGGSWPSWGRLPTISAVHLLMYLPPSIYSVHIYFKPWFLKYVF